MENDSKKKKIYIGTCIVIAILCVLYLGVDYYKKFQAEKLTKEAAKESVVVKIEKEESEAPEIFVQVDFEKLHELNPDIYAWIIVPGTNVSYPVVQSPKDKDTDYYLNHNLDGSTGYPGGIYTQKRNAKDFSDPDTVIYGHNMKNKTMFGSLHEYEKEEFFKEHPYIYIITEDQNLVYEIFAAIWYDDRLVLDYYSDFAFLADYEEYLKSIPQYEGIYNADTAPSKDDKIITLATCIAKRPNNRFHVIGRLLSDEEVRQLSAADKQAVADTVIENTKDFLLF